jgi:hypothetical protein
MRIRTFADVHRAFARRGAPTKQSVAAAMGKRPDVFSREISDWGAQPSEEWVAEFTHAWEQAKEQGAA